MDVFPYRPDQPAKEYLNISELSARSGLSVSTIRRLVDHGKIEVFQPGGPRTKLLFRPGALEITPPAGDVLDADPAASDANRPPLSGRRPGWMKPPTTT
jgi:hypothetical protein